MSQNKQPVGADNALETHLEDANQTFLANQIKSINDALGIAEKKERARLEEHFFVNVFLPWFAADKDQKYKIEVGHWLGISTHPMAEVDIIDNDGNVLFTVPPVFSQTSFKSKPSREHSMTHIIAHANALGNIHASQSEAYMKRALGSKFGSMENSINTLDYAKRWNAIFARYDRKDAIIPLEEEQTKSGETKPRSDLGDLDFELA